MNPPTQEERRLSEILSRYSMLCRWGKFKEADDLFGSQTQGDQMTISKVCNEKTRDALNDTAQYGRVVLASERKMLEKAEDEKGRPLTREEVQAYEPFSWPCYSGPLTARQLLRTRADSPPSP